MRPAVCEHRQTDRLKENYSIDGAREDCLELFGLPASTLKQISKFYIGLIFSKFVSMENIDRDVILVRENVVTRVGRAIIRPTRLDL